MSTRHPRALYVLALVQLWERFACFATLPLLVLYLQQRHSMRSDEAVLVFGLLQALSYLAGLPGGYLADRWLGSRLATLLGAGLLTFGYGMLPSCSERPSRCWLRGTGSSSRASLRSPEGSTARATRDGTAAS